MNKSYENLKNLKISIENNRDKLQKLINMSKNPLTSREVVKQSELLDELIAEYLKRAINDSI